MPSIAFQSLRSHFVGRYRAGNRGEARDDLEKIHSRLRRENHARHRAPIAFR
jgi:hypothetical protein